MDQQERLAAAAMPEPRGPDPAPAGPEPEAEWAAEAPLPYQTWRRWVVLALLLLLTTLVIGGGAAHLSGADWLLARYVPWTAITLGVAALTGWIAFASVAAGDQAPDPGMLPRTLQPWQRARTALVVIHGIGQQERYETLSNLVTGLDGVPAKHPEFPVTAGHDPDLETPARVRANPLEGANGLDLTGVQLLTWREDRPDEPPVPIDIYEVFWAPLAQRQRSFKDVLGWGLEVTLLTAARFGFRRPGGAPGAVIRRPDALTIREIQAKGRREALFVAGAMLVTVGAAYAGWLLFALFRRLATGGGGAFPWFPVDPVKEITAAIKSTPASAVVLAGLMLVGLSFWAQGWLRVRALRRELAQLEGVLAGGGDPDQFRATQDQVHGVAGALSQHWFRGVLGAVAALAALQGFLGNRDPVWRDSLALAALLFAFQQIWKYVQAAVVGYLGDIPTYVMTSENGATYQARKAVQQKAEAVISSVLAERHPGGGEQYTAVILLGHSLGSVVGRDALLGLFSAAEGAPDEPDRLKQFHRIKAWITFGSPLRKTQAFFDMRTQASAALETLRRTRDAAVFDNDRPGALVRTSGGRVRWYNFWETDDLVANPLRDRYPIWHESRILLGAGERTPLFTHNDYWGSREFAGAVLRIVRDVSPPDPT